MFAIKTKWNSIIKDISLNKRNYVFRLISLILGLYIFTLAIAIASQTAVGVSMIDFTVFASLFQSAGLMESTGSILPGTIQVQGSNYALYCGILYAGMSVVSLSMMAIWISKDYKKSGDKFLFILLGLAAVGDVIVIFGVPLLIEMNLLYVPGQTIANASSGIRAYIFMGAFLMYALGLAFWVNSKLLSGPYNAICANFLKLTGIKSYSIGRTSMNVLIILPGFIVVFIMGLTGTSWSEIGDFLTVNLSFGTIFYVFILGMTVTTWTKLIKKILVMKPQISPEEPIQESLNLE